MSSQNLARRTKVAVVFGGVDITKEINRCLIDLSYTDNESDEADDLQIKIDDRDGTWVEKWLDTVVQTAAAAAPAEVAVQRESLGTAYKVVANSGLNVRSGPGDSYSKYGVLPYGSLVDVQSIKDGWATITYSGKQSYVMESYLRRATESMPGTNNWSVGDAVVVNGRPQYSSYGSGNPGSSVANFHGTITHLNLGNDIPYPIHVGQLGWFAVSQVQKAGIAATQQSGFTEKSIKGLHVQASIVRENWQDDGKDSVLDCGAFELDSIDYSGPPATVVFKATALPFKSSVRQVRKSRAWENYKLSGIAAEIAQKNGMACLYESEFDPEILRAEQVEQSDIAVLKGLCEKYGISLKASANILILFDQSAYEAKDPVKTVSRGATGEYIKYKFRTGKNDTQYSACHVKYTDPYSGKTIEYTYTPETEEKASSKDGQVLEIRRKVNSAAEAKVLAQKMLRLKNKYEYTADFTFPGDSALVAGVTVNLKDWGLYSGKYIISQAKHSVGGSGYTTTVKLRKVLEGY